MTIIFTESTLKGDGVVYLTFSLVQEIKFLGLATTQQLGVFIRSLHGVKREFTSCETC